MPRSIHFEMSERKILLRLMDVFTVILTLYVVGIVFNFDYFLINEKHWSWSIVLIVYLLFFATVFELYNLHKASRIADTLKGVFSIGSLTCLCYLLTPFFTPLLPESRIQILYFYLSVTLSLLFWRAIYIKFFASSRFDKNIFLIADWVDVAFIARSLQEVDPNYKIRGFINTGDSITQNQSLEIELMEVHTAQKLFQNRMVSEVVVASNTPNGITNNIYSWLIELTEKGYLVREYTQVYEEMTDRIPVRLVGRDFYRFFPFSRNNQNRLYLIFNRFNDIVVAATGLLICMAMIPLINIGNLIANRGPLFYSQERVGMNGVIFRIIKFRTMIQNAESKGAQFAAPNDMRVTKFGRFLRHTRIDEFPQFWNILKGEMSLIGPRPERDVFVKELSKKIPFYETRHVIKPGLTGWAQVKTKYGITHEDHLKKLQYDLYYIKKRNVFLDLRIIIKTLSTIIFFKGQ